MYLGHPSSFERCIDKAFEFRGDERKDDTEHLSGSLTVCLCPPLVAPRDLYEYFSFVFFLRSSLAGARSAFFFSSYFLNLVL